MNLLNYIMWDVSPEIFQIGNFALRWYGLLFAGGFFIGHFIMMQILKWEGKPAKDLDAITMTMLISTVIGARLGHCFFYDPMYYLLDPIKILKVWEGGLASHGAAVGILVGIYLYSRKRPDQPYLWILDRIVICIALAGSLIRVGNLMNSEIIGKATELPWGFIFPRNHPHYPILSDTIPRHPTQLYEAGFYFFVFIILWALYNKYRSKTPTGLIFGIFLIGIFGFRFAVENLKEVQESFENDLFLNMGQMLSIPFILVGIVLIFKAKSFSIVK